MNDSQFTTTLMVIIGVLIGSTIGILALANVLISDADFSEDVVIQGNIEERIKPVGRINTTEEELVAAEGDTSSNNAAGDGKKQQVADTSISPEKLYTQACSSCHATGVLNAPKVGDKASWKSRIAKGKEQLYASAINGIGTMPPKGGRSDISDDDIKKAVDYMLGSVQ